MSEAILTVRNLSRRFAASGNPAVEDLSLELRPGEILALIGPSGCGKTTTLRMIAGFERPDSGQVLLGGRDVTAIAPERRGIGMVFQDYALFPHMTVAENILFGAHDKTAASVRHYLGIVGLDDFGQRYPDELSGGQQQRVALARSLAAQPGLILLDEPFSNLDAALRHSTRREIRSMLKRTGIGIIFVTHDQEEALSFADRIAIMRDGRLLQEGAARDVYDHPVDAFVAGFLGRTNLLAGQGSGLSADTILGPVALTQAIDGPAMLSLRPERVQIRAAGAGESGNGRVLTSEFKGHDMTYWVACNGMELQVDTMSGERLDDGASVVLSVAGRVVPLHRG